MEESPISQWSTMRLTPHGIEQLSSCYHQAKQIGDNTAIYLRFIIEQGKMEQRIIDGCKAILRLARLYGNQTVENGCHRALQGKKYNYNTIKAIITNGLAHEIVIDQQQEDEDYKITHQNLRGADFFENNSN